MQLQAGMWEDRLVRRQRAMFDVLVSHVALTYLLPGYSLYQLSQVCRSVLPIERAHSAFQHWLNKQEGGVDALHLDTRNRNREYHAARLQRSFLRDVMRLRHAGLSPGSVDPECPPDIAIAGSYPAAMYLANTKLNCRWRPGDIDLFLFRRIRVKECSFFICAHSPRSIALE
jgi:hypothetical protein